MRIEETLRLANRSADPHQLMHFDRESAHRAAVAVVLWGDLTGARRVLLAQRGDTAPRNAGELAFPGGMTEPEDRDLPATARRELMEELTMAGEFWELGCFPDGVAKGCTRFTPVFFRWEQAEPKIDPGPEMQRALLLPLQGLLDAPWSQQEIHFEGRKMPVPRLEMAPVPLWGATARVLKAWLDVLAGLR